jgi:F420-dependent oxidoreductase-like protein
VTEDLEPDWPRTQSAGRRSPVSLARVFGDQIRFGVYSGPQHATFEGCLELWRRCEELGYDWLSVFDHFMPIVGDPDGPCFEGPTMMAAMAAHTSRVRVAILVTGVTYRHPAVAANMAATIDHISGGRAEYGIGAGWFEEEHRQYGIPFPRLGVRMDMLDEACRVMRGLWTEERVNFDGEHFALEDAQMDPKPLQARLPLIIGGEGEKRTLRIVAEHADVWNTGLGEIETFRHKLDVLSRHCAAVGRDPAEIRKSLTFRAILAEDEAALKARRRELAPTLPIDESNFLFLTPEQCVERMLPFAELGARDFLLAAYSPYDWRSLELVAREVAPALRPRPD